MYQRAVDNDMLESMKKQRPNLVSCPHCPFTVELPAGETIIYCRAPLCNKVSCKLCQMPAHRGIRCEDVEQDQATKARIKLEEAMTKALLRTCSSCGASFSKEAGCNKMTCKCGVMMCYLCKVTIPHKVGYEHFKPKGKCELWYANATENAACWDPLVLSHTHTRLIDPFGFAMIFLSQDRFVAR
jgi:hypothetical protein